MHKKNAADCPKFNASLVLTTDNTANKILQILMTIFNH